MERRATVEAAVADLPLMLTVEQTCAVLGIGRSLAYAEVRRYLATAGRGGIPAIRIGSAIRVPRVGLVDLMLAVPVPVVSGVAPLHTVTSPSSGPDSTNRTRRRRTTRSSRTSDVAQLPFAAPD
jgi:hypothetical protein